MDGAGHISPQSEPNDDSPWQTVHLPCPLCAMPIEVFAVGGPVEVTCESCALTSTLETPFPVIEDESIEITVPSTNEVLKPTDDMSRWLAGEPIEYFPGSAYKQLRRFSKQNILVAYSIVAGASLLVIGLLTLGWGYVNTQFELAKVQQLSQDEILSKQQRLLRMQMRLHQQEQQQLELEQQRQLAEREAIFLKSKYLAAQASSLLASSPRRSAQFAVEAANATLCQNGPLLTEAHQPLRDLLAPIDGLRLEGHTEEITSLAVSPDSRWLASGDAQGRVLLWDMLTPTRPAAFVALGEHQKRVSDMLFSSDNRWLVTGSHDATVCMWDMMAKNPSAKPWKLKGSTDSVYALAMSNNSRWLIAGGGDELFDGGTARLWDLSAGVSAAAPTELKRNTGPIRTVAISPNNQWLALGVDEAARLWDLSTREPTVASLVLQGHAGAISSAIFTEDNRWLVTCGRDHRGKDCIARLWMLSSKDHSESIVLGGHRGAIRAIAASPDGHWLVTGDDRRTLRVWDLRSPDPSAKPRVLKQSPGDIHSIAISRDNRWLAVGGEAGEVQLWSLTEQGPSELPVTIETGNDQLRSLVFSPDSQWLATAGSERSVRLWNLNIDLMLLQASKIATSKEPSPWPQTFSDVQRITRFGSSQAVGWSQLAEDDRSQGKDDVVANNPAAIDPLDTHAANNEERLPRPVVEYEPIVFRDAGETALDYRLGNGVRKGKLTMILAAPHSADLLFRSPSTEVEINPFNPLRLSHGSSEQSVPIIADPFLGTGETLTK